MPSPRAPWLAIAALFALSATCGGDEASADAGASTDGVSWGTIAIAEAPANCAFGGVDRRTLYVTARTGLYRAAMVIPGA